MDNEIQVWKGKDISIWRWGKLRDGECDTALEVGAFQRYKPVVKKGDTPLDEQEHQITKLRFTFPAKCISCSRECVCITFGMFDVHHICIECLEHLTEDACFAFDKEKMSLLIKHGKPIPPNKIGNNWNGFEEQEARGDRKPTDGFY